MSKGSRLREQRRTAASFGRHGRSARPPASPPGESRDSRWGLFAAVSGAAMLIAAVLIGVSVLTSDEGGPEPPAAVDGRGAAALFAGIPQDGTALGSPDAPVTLVEFADFQCPFCATFALGALPELVRDYVRPGRVRIEFRALGFLGPDSDEARRYALAASAQDRFWELAHLLFEHQGEENSGWVTPETLEAIAGGVAGLDFESMAAQRDGAAVDELIDEAEAHADRFGVSSTPSFLAGRTGGELERVEVESLDAAALRPTLDRLLDE